MEESHFVDALDGPEDLETETEAGRQGEGAPRLGASQLGQIAPLQLHHNVVEPVVAAASDEAADVLFPCSAPQQQEQQQQQFIFGKLMSTRIRQDRCRSITRNDCARVSMRKGE